MGKMTRKMIIKKTNEKWEIDYLNTCIGQSTSLSAQIFPKVPHTGFYVKVNDFLIAEKYFPVEYKRIHDAYFRVIDKCQKMDRFEYNSLQE